MIEYVIGNSNREKDAPYCDYCIQVERERHAPDCPFLAELRLACETSWNNLPEDARREFGGYIAYSTKGGEVISMKVVL